MQCFWHFINAVHASCAVFIVYCNFFFVCIIRNAFGWAIAANQIFDIETCISIFCYFSLIDLDCISPSTQNRNISTSLCRNTVIWATGNFNFGFVRPHWSVQFCLVSLCNIVQEIQSIKTCIFATARTYAAAWCSEVRTGTTQVPTSIRQIIEAFLQMVCCSTQEYDITCCTVHIRQTGTMFFPDIAQSTNIGRIVEPTRCLVYTYSVEFCNSWIFFWAVCVTTDNAAAVTSNPYDTTVFPVYAFFFI